jgi:hypothetical protein
MEGQPEGEDFPDGVARLARFNADQVRAIECALAEHLAVDATHVTADGFSLTPEPSGAFGVHWRGSARIDSATFHRIVQEATADDETAAQRWREHLPEPRGALARPRHFRRRRPRRDASPAEHDGSPGATQG